MSRLLLAALLAAGGACAQPASGTGSGPAPAAAPARTIAITIDDLPIGGPQGTLADQQEVTRGLLAQIRAAGVPVAGFVNECKVDRDPREARTDLLRAWADAGHTLGNHTCAHSSFWDTPLADFQADVVRGEPITRALLAERGDSLVYFRHPYLNTGPDLPTRTAFEAWIANRGYTIAPVTHDNSEWLYAFAYHRAAGDAELQARIAEAYLDYMDATTAYMEGLSADLFGREIAGVLLLHANRLNADHLGRLLDRFRTRGYAFVTLAEALQDPAYASADTYTGRAGISWLQRWAITRGVGFEPEPAPEPWVHRVAYPER